MLACVIELLCVYHVLLCVIMCYGIVCCHVLLCIYRVLSCYGIVSCHVLYCVFTMCYRTRSNYSNILIPRTTSFSILFPSEFIEHAEFRIC